MRKNAPRKWIHAILDLLPLFVIPIFAIYSQRHEINDYVVEKEIVKEVNFNQIQTSLEDVTSFYANDVKDFTFNDNNGSFSININGGNINSYPSRLTINREHIYYYCIDAFSDNQMSRFTLNNYSSAYLSSAYTKVGALITNYDFVYFTLSGNENAYIEFKNMMCFDLTQMFGSGNEPTVQQFNEWYSNDYYEYTTGRRELLYTGEYDPLNDTDIGSQFIYQMYNVTDKYFNFNNLFNMQGIYDWLQLNLFGGNAPLPVTIVWNIIVYEFFVDLIFLLYSVFMFFIDFATNMIDSFTRRNGGR